MHPNPHRLAAGLGAEVFPEAARHAPVLLVPVLSSSLVCGTQLALLVKGLFCLGVRGLSGYLAGKGADGARAHQRGGRQVTELRFDH